MAVHGSLETISDRADFDVISHDSVFIRGNAFNLRGVCGSKYSSSKVAFAIPKKLGNAVVRNLIRRRLRNAIRDSRANYEWMNGRYLFIAKEYAVQVPYTELVREVTDLVGAVIARQGRTKG